VAEEIFEAGRNTINRGNVEMGLDFMLEGINLYEQIHSVIHPEVAVAYNHYAIALHQLARLKMQQLASEGVEQDTPLGLDLATALRLQRQAVIVAERTLGIHHAETIGYYYNLAMLENLENNPEASLRYFRYIIQLWQVVYGDQHPELQGVFVSCSKLRKPILIVKDQRCCHLAEHGPACALAFSA
jgi:protein TIF31